MTSVNDEICFADRATAAASPRVLQPGFRGFALLFLLIIAAAPAARAIDGGIGRSISGEQILPGQAVVPDAPGVFFASVGAVYYPGAIGGAKTFPVGRQLLANIDADLLFVPLTIAYDWPVGKGGWNFLSGVIISYVSEELTANVMLGGKSTGRESDSASGLYDLMFRVVQASYAFSKSDHLSISLDIWAPTGEYDPNALANLSLDNWTYITTLSYTKYFDPGLELSALWALEYYSPNRHTDYHSGMLSRMEAMLIKQIVSGFGVGVIGSWIAQINDDTGSLADTFDGFRGHAYGVGPIVTWSGKVGKVPLSVNARWVHEFSNKNMLQGDVFSLSVTMPF